MGSGGDFDIAVLLEMRQSWPRGVALLSLMTQERRVLFILASSIECFKRTKIIKVIDVLPPNES